MRNNSFLLSKKFLLLTFCILLHTTYLHAQVYGCTDPLATNFNSSATDNDGSCIYPVASVSPVTSTNLGASLQETSGLIKWNGTLWTHNDNTDINIYSIDTIAGNIIQSYPLTGAANNDWEEISQDSSYVYVGDFGNNVNGNRTDLKILRVEKNSLLAQNPVIDTISFFYSDQVNFSPAGNNNTDFDCEAFVVTADSIYLFTKQWVSNKTSLYVIPKTPGTYSAALKTTFDVQGLITGAVLLAREKVVGLCGYTSFLQPFVWLLYDFTGSEFFSGNKRKISVPLPFHQIEGITSSDGLTWYMTNEYFSIVPTPQKLHIFDFSQYLVNYLNGLTQEVPQRENGQSVSLYPNPSTGCITIKCEDRLTAYSLLNTEGKVLKSGTLTDGESEINISELPKGTYFLNTGAGKGYSLRLIKK
jgi:hypothetical protein